MSKNLLFIPFLHYLMIFLFIFGFNHRFKISFYDRLSRFSSFQVQVCTFSVKYLYSGFYIRFKENVKSWFIKTSFAVWLTRFNTSEDVDQLLDHNWLSNGETCCWLVSLQHAILNQNPTSRSVNTPLEIKRGCVFPMVISPAFRMAQYRVNDHPYHAPQFTSRLKDFEGTRYIAVNHPIPIQAVWSLWKYKKFTATIRFFLWIIQIYSKKYKSIFQKLVIVVICGEPALTFSLRLWIVRQESYDIN